MLHPALRAQMSKLLHVQAPTGDVGIELEIEGENLPRSVLNWSRHVENSLRGANGRVISSGEDLPDTPQEYVTNGPVLIDQLSNVLGILHSKLQASKVKVNLTNRASTHIHLNFSGETLLTLFRYILIFTIAEPVILRLCGPSRNGNLFCLPSYETGDLPAFITRISHAAQGYSFDPNKALPAEYYAYFRQLWPPRGKYAALNLDPLKSLGSVECRCFPNTIDPVQIEGWARMLVRMREYARQDIEPRDIIERAYTDPLGFLSKFMTLNNLFVSCAPNHPSELVAFGTEYAYEILCKMFFLLEYNPEKAAPTKGKKKLMLDLELQELAPAPEFDVDEDY